MEESILKEFCSKDNSRPNLCNPFNIDEYTYATNGHIAVRIDKDSKYDKNPIIEQIVPLMTFEEFSNKLIDMPKIENPRKEEICERCKGTGKDLECPECEGEGEISWVSDYDHEYSDWCQMCSGTGKLSEGKDTCEKCQGIGKLYEDKIIEVITNVWCNAYLLSIINKLPDTKIAPDQTTPLKAIPFIFNEGIGLIMPCRQPNNVWP